MYFTVDARSERQKEETPELVEFVIQNNGADEKRLTLLEGGKWTGGLKGTFTTPVSDDLPVNNLFLLLKKEDEDGEDFLTTVCSADLEPEQAGTLSLNIVQKDGKQSSVPIRSVERGTSSVSFYRQSEHQSL